MNSTNRARTVARLAVSGFSAVVIGSVLLAASPASANVPEGWSNPESVNPLHFLAVVLGIPAALALVIILLVIAPGLARGEKFVHSNSAPEAEWFGGPRTGTEELPAPDTAESKAGGASGRW
ncbi:hypothetical protein [Nocardioides daejeonensis]|uniref:hypothetical protein n=1 Tax=Nocardioides daejeonensis TaxID=1046556 RepID=UPI0013A5A876|nr:hypothetical protein [Nocardioides daejeonensis]